jgi:hypothetical protein
MEEMGRLSKEEYVCPVYSCAGSKGSSLSKDRYCPSSSLCSESDRPDSRFYSNHRLLGRPRIVAIRNLVGCEACSPGGMEGVLRIGLPTSKRNTTQSSGCDCDYNHLAFGNRWVHALGLAIHKRDNQHPTTALTRKFRWAPFAPLTLAVMQNIKSRNYILFV